MLGWFTKAEKKSDLQTIDSTDWGTNKVDKVVYASLNYSDQKFINFNFSMPYPALLFGIVIGAAVSSAIYANREKIADILEITAETIRNNKHVLNAQSSNSTNEKAHECQKPILSDSSSDSEDTERPLKKHHHSSHRLRRHHHHHKSRLEKREDDDHHKNFSSALDRDNRPSVHRRCHKHSKIHESSKSIHSHSYHHPHHKLQGDNHRKDKRNLFSIDQLGGCHINNKTEGQVNFSLNEERFKKNPSSSESYIPKQVSCLKKNELENLPTKTFSNTEETTKNSELVSSADDLIVLNKAQNKSNSTLNNELKNKVDSNNLNDEKSELNFKSIGKSNEVHDNGPDLKMPLSDSLDSTWKASSSSQNDQTAEDKFPIEYKDAHNHLNTSLKVDTGYDRTRSSSISSITISNDGSFLDSEDFSHVESVISGSE